MTIYILGALKIDLFNDQYLEMEPAKDAGSAPRTKTETGKIKIDVRRGFQDTLKSIADVSTASLERNKYVLNLEFIMK